MDLQLEDKTALVTGFTAGIGLAIARALAGEGASVIINGRTQDRVDQALRRIKDENTSAKVIGIAADLSDAAGTEKIMDEAPLVEVLINYVGIYGPSHFKRSATKTGTRFLKSIS